PEYGAPALGAAAGVAALQVPRVNHYPTDVAAGMLLGAVSASFANAVLPPLDEEEAAIDGEVMPEEPLPPPRRA
ncbi:MAG: hypothetical protein H0V46_07995, partial [Sphingomonas sp.]|nr:hypothetical protein [Sphingomonas sp.]